MRLNHQYPPYRIEFQFNKLYNSTISIEWCFLIFGVLLGCIAVFGNGYVSYRLIKILRVSKAIQTPIYLSLTLCGLATGIFCIPYMMVHFYRQRISNFQEKSTLESDIRGLKEIIGEKYYKIHPITDTLSPLADNTTTAMSSTTRTPYVSTTDTLQNNKRNLKELKIQRNTLTYVIEGWELVLCNISGFVFNTTSRLVIWLMLLLSIDRYIFICRPYRIHLVKKSHYAIWILVSFSLLVFVAILPYFFKKQYKVSYSTGYICEFGIDEMISKDSSIVLVLLIYFGVVVFVCLLPVTLNVFFSIRILIEISRMKKVSKENVPCYTTMSTRGSRKLNCTSVSQVGSPPLSQVCTDYIELGDRKTQHRTPFKSRRATVIDTIKEDVAGVINKLSCYYKNKRRSSRQGSVLENKASMTMIILFLFYIVTYTAWIIVWISTILMVFNSYGSDEKDWFRLWLYNSTDPVAYTFANYYAFATFANSAFVPVLLCYSLHRGK